ncbi:GIY-YIG nuclease family protein [Kitasatospora sp. NPDC054768]
MAQPQPLTPELERQCGEYVQLLRAGMLSPYSLPAVASAVEEAVLARAWARTRDPFESVGSRLYILSVAGTHRRVKVGRSDNARERIATHLNEYHCNGHGLIDAWISNSLLNADLLETAIHKLLRICHQPSYRREEYPDGDFESICALAADLDAKHSLTEEQVRFHEWDRQERMRKGGEEILREIEYQTDRAFGVGETNGSP